MTESLSLDAVMRALSDPTRRAVYERIARVREVSVVDLTRESGVTQGAVSQHLRKLKEAGLVADRPEGRQVFYHARTDGLSPLADWLGHHKTFWRERFDNLRALLEDMDE